MFLSGFVLYVALLLMPLYFQGLDRGQIADASIITRAAQQIGGSFGGAVLAVVLASGLAQHTGGPAAAFRGTFWWATGFSIAAVLLALWLPAGRPAEG